MVMKEVVPLFLVRSVLVTIAAVFGFTCNLWIVYVNLEDRRRGFHLSPPDLILSFMALINVPMQLVFCFDMSSLATGFYDRFDPIHLELTGVMIFLVSCNIWFTAWLSVYYYLRIVNFTDGLLLVLKMRISKLLPKLLVVSTVESFIIALPSFWNIYSKVDEETIGNSTSDSTFIFLTSPYLITTFLGCIIPLVLTLLPIGLTLRSLWRHLKRMNMNNGDSSRPRTQAHITAVRTMVLLVTLQSGFHAVSLYVLTESFNFIDPTMIISGCFIMLYPTFQALVMITGNSKLKKAGRGILKNGGAWWNVLLGRQMVNRA
ncbi:taste receptor type 2 member 40-like [Hyla sarda]|uniref:taste receptor type 2 member 40-like n=1 Tax=Hyla sarda TaxID=327740 RepID=UPI0024C389EF|nr:taste receptor type 2 member 40-like [Hyla sarda]XP_056392711.1 taste receptor type 2 member 40-like [Hyla sarda]XP_056409142.1 taste receptor type 2 member 40-like [Hyla sarda]